MQGFQLQQLLLLQDLNNVQYTYVYLFMKILHFATEVLFVRTMWQQVLIKVLGIKRKQMNAQNT